MFTLGSITCPTCAAPLRLLKFTASAAGYSAEAVLRCPTESCLFDYQLAATLTALPLLAPSPRVEEPEAPQVTDPPADLEVPGLEDLHHVDSPEVLHAPDYRDDEGRYPCPRCGEVLLSPQGFAAHQRKHEPKEPCPHGCGRMVKASGVGRHVASGCPALKAKTTTQEDQPCPPPPPPTPPPPAAASTAGKAGSSSSRAGTSAPSATGTTPRRSSRRVDPAATAAAREKGKEKAARSSSRRTPAPTTPKGSTTSGAGATGDEDKPKPPLRGASHQVCGMVDEAGPCGRVKERADRGWRRARTSEGWMDLCPDHADVDDAEVAELLKADSLPPVT